MLTRFISDTSYETLNVEYPNDSDIQIENSKIGVDGNLEYTKNPVLSGMRDLKINNYVLNIISKNEKLSNLIKLKQNNKIKNKMCLFYTSSSYKIDSDSKFWKFENNEITTTTFYDYVADANIFEIDYINEELCKITYVQDTSEYALSYSLSLSSVKFIPLSSNNINQYNLEFNYALNENNEIFFYVKNEFGNSYLENYQNRIIIRKRKNLIKNNYFVINGIDNLDETNNCNNWISYSKSFNTNNLDINKERSHFDIKNNFLFSTTINSIVSSLPINILTLKNQLNQENDQSRGNVFLNENETNLKEYESIFTGGWRELGYDKINLGYTSYSTPFTFKSGKTTYFHVPHDIYPYKKLNINSTKLAESGAIGGNSPLNSDKIWKKLKDYKDSTPYSIPKEENNGQWLCTWLSAGNMYSKPVWVDRYYKPSKTTPYLALSASSNSVVYKDSFECLDLNDNIADVKSSLTFEKGCYYAYMHLGKKDYRKLIEESISSKIYYTKLKEYQNTSFDNLQEDGIEYVFDGKNYGFIDSEEKFDYNTATLSFFIEKDNWDVPSGNMILGNYVNNGFGFYNYKTSTPYKIFKINDTTLQITNNNYEKIDKLYSNNLTSSTINGIARRDAFENIHIITNDFKLIEMDLKGTIVDANSAIQGTLNLKPTDRIFSITNDLNYCYVHTNSGIARVDLFNNSVSSINIHKTVTTSYTTSSFIIADNESKIYRVYGINPIIRNGIVYFMDNVNKIFSYDTKNYSLSTLNVNSGILCFNIDSNDNLNIVGRDNYIYTYNENNQIIEKILLPSLNAYSLSARMLTFCEKFEEGNLRKIKEIYCENDNTKQKYIIKIDEKQNQELIRIDENYNFVQPNLDFNGYNFNKGYLENYYGKNNYNFKIKLLNQINDEDYTMLDFIIKKEDLGTGLRHFVFTIDCLNGLGDFYLDGKLYESKYFEKGKYVLSKTFNGRIFYGSNGYHNGTPAFEHFKDKLDFTYGSIKLLENNIINKFLDRFEVLYFYNILNPSDDIKYNMPSGTRSFIDKIEKTFNFNIPMHKTSCFNLKLLNTGIENEKLRDKLENEIKDKIQEFLPYYVKINKLEWLNNKVEKLVLEGDYNVSNTLINI